jgi:hypothetical protein
MVGLLLDWGAEGTDRQLSKTETCGLFHNAGSNPQSETLAAAER